MESRRESEESLGWAPKRAAVLALLAALAFLAARWPMGAWTIDDAGITASYARAIASGEGSSVYPGGMPVEGFSNPLSLALTVVLIRLGLFDPLLTHVFLELAFFAVAIGLVLLGLVELGIEGRMATLTAALFAGLQLLTPASLIWYSSGLENVQVTAALAALFWMSARWMRNAVRPATDAALLLLVSLVRPETFLYPLAVGVAVLVLYAVGPGRAPERAATVRVGRVFVLVAAAGVLLLALRVHYFGELLPNTYFAKADGAFQSAQESGIFENFRDYVFGELLTYHGSGLLAAAGLAGAAVAWRFRQTVALVLMLLASCALPSLAGPDWMGEHRFGTPFMALSQLLFVFGLASLLQAASGDRVHARAIRFASTAAVSGLVIWFAWTGPPRYLRFVAQPHATFENVADAVGFVRRELQARLGLFAPHVLVADLGGSSFVGGMQSIDLLRLTDYHLARTQSSPPQQVQYIYGERTPALIEAHHRIPRYPGFGMDYFVATEFSNPHSGGRIRYLARRDLVEVRHPAPEAIRIGEAGGFDLWLSERNIGAAAPGAIVRVELLLRPRQVGSSRVDTLRVCVAGSCDEQAPFQYHPLGPSRLHLVKDRYYRQAFLVQVPSRPGSYRVSLEVTRDGEHPLRHEIVEVAVVTSVAGSEVVARIQSGKRSLLRRAALLAQLKEQAKPRMPPRERKELLERYREAARGREWSAVGYWRRLARDFSSPLHPTLRPEIDRLEETLLGAFDQRANRQLARRRPRSRKRAAERLARMAFNMRRLGFEAGDVLRRLDVGPENGNVEKRYFRSVLRATLQPGNVQYQKDLLEARAMWLTRSVAQARPAPMLYSPRSDDGSTEGARLHPGS